jgi:hypothetical protein
MSWLLCLLPSTNASMDRVSRLFEAGSMVLVSVDRGELASDAVTLLLASEVREAATEARIRCGVHREALRPTRMTQRADARSHHPCHALYVRRHALGSARLA